jgi:hypothetical protein
VDAKKDVNVSHEPPDSLDLELQVSLSEALLQLACAQHQTNQFLAQIVEQNQRLISQLVDEPDEAEPREDMEGKPIREQ